MMRIRSGRAAVLALLLLLRVSFPVKAANGEPALSIEDARIVEARGVEGESSVETDGRSFNVCLGTLTCPGACMEIGLTIVNTGNETATLVQTGELDCGLADISVSFPELSTDGSETIAPGGRCTLTLVIAWDEDSRAQYPEGAQGNFSFVLEYTADGVTLVAGNGEETSPSSKTAAAAGAAQTGDRTDISRFVCLAAASLGGGLLLLLDSRKEGRDDEKRL